MAFQCLLQMQPEYSHRLVVWEVTGAPVTHRWCWRLYDELQGLVADSGATSRQHWARQLAFEAHTVTAQRVKGPAFQGLLLWEGIADR